MPELDGKLGPLIITFLPAIIGLVIDIIVRRDFGESMARQENACDEVILDKIKDKMSEFCANLKNEINRVISNAMAPPRDLTIEMLDLNIHSPKIDKEFLSGIIEILRYQRRFENTRRLLNVFDCLFVIYILAALLSLVYVYNPSYLIVMMIISISTLVFYFLVLIYIKSNKQNILRKYGI